MTPFQGVGYDSPPIERAVKSLRPRGLRFPGGTIANNYLWKEDSFSEPTNDKTKWAAEQLRLFRKIGRPYDLPGFARLCNRASVEPIWVLNVYEESPTSVVELIAKFDQLGLNVKKIELANEPYWDGRSLMNVRDYIKVAEPMALAIKKHRPEIQIGACFGNVAEDMKYNDKWNAPLAKLKWHDAIVYHEYFGGQGIVLEKGSKIPVEAMLHPEAIFEDPVQKFSETLPGKPIWFTEWNIGTEGLKQWKNTGAELLYLGASYVSLVDQRSSIKLACFHQLYGTNFGLFRVNKESGQVETTASWQFFDLLGATIDGCEELRPVSFGDADLRGFATEGETGLRMFAINRSDRQAARNRCQPVHRDS